MSGDLGIVSNGPLGLLMAGLKAQLELLFTPAKFTHRLVPARLDTSSWKALTERTPLVGRGFNLFHRVKTGRALVGQSAFAVYLATRNSRGEEERLMGDALAPGILAMGQIAAAGLHGHTVAGAGTFQVEQMSISIAEEFDDAQLALATLQIAVEHSIGLRELVAGDVLDGADWLRTGIDWKFNDAVLRDEALEAA